MPKADPLGLLGDPHGGNEGKKDAKTGSASNKRNNRVSERGHIRHSEQYQVPQGKDSSRREKEVEWLRRLVRDLELEAKDRR